MASQGVPIVLVVDDEKVIRNAMARVLRDHCRVLVAECADEALAHLGAQPVDIVLADYQMPGRDGEDLLREVQRDHPAVRRAMVSGTPPDHLKRLIDEGLIEAFVAKPWTVDELLVLVKNLAVRE